MNSGDYASIGREWKRLHPGKYEDHSDETVGVVVIKKANINLNPHFFLETRSKHRAKQLDLIISEITKMGRIQMETHKHLHEMVELPKVLSQQSEIHDANHASTKAGFELQTQLTQIASSLNVDVPTLMAAQLHKLTTDTNLQDFEKRTDIEIQKHQRMAQIDLDKKRLEQELDRKHLLEARRISDELDRQNSRTIDIGKEPTGLNAGSDSDPDA